MTSKGALAIDVGKVGPTSLIDDTLIGDSLIFVVLVELVEIQRAVPHCGNKQTGEEGNLFKSVFDGI